MNKDYKRGIRDTLGTIVVLGIYLSIFAIWILK